MAGFAIKVKTKGGQRILRDLTTQTTLGELKSVLSDVSNIPVANLHILCGFPPTTLNAADENSPLSECGISSGDTLILEEKESEAPKSSLTKDHVASENFESLQASSCPGLLMKHVVPADNSCLFTSIYFALNGKVDDSGTASPWMRKLIAETVSNDTNYFSEAILGKPNADYCKWIQDDKSWGGAIEISIMADYYGIEIAVVDTINAIINRFGEDKNFPHRVFLLFDGIHYDPLFLEPIDVSDKKINYFIRFNQVNVFRVEIYKQYFNLQMRESILKLRSWQKKQSLVDNIQM